MPWRTATVETERAQFVVEAQASDLSHAELCRRYRISRQTGYNGCGAMSTRGSRALRTDPHGRAPARTERRRTW